MSDKPETIKVILRETPARLRKKAVSILGSVLSNAHHGARLVAEVDKDGASIFWEEQQEVDGEWRDNPDPEGESIGLRAEDIEKLAYALAVIREHQSMAEEAAQGFNEAVAARRAKESATAPDSLFELRMCEKAAQGFSEAVAARRAREHLRPESEPENKPESEPQSQIEWLDPGLAKRTPASAAGYITAEVDGGDVEAVLVMMRRSDGTYRMRGFGEFLYSDTALMGAAISYQAAQQLYGDYVAGDDE